jgi:transporter family-2 protein
LTVILAFLGAILGGIAVAVQGPLNAALARSLGSALPAAAVSFGVGFAVLAAISLAVGAGSLARLSGVPLWQLAGGFLGAWYVTALIWGVSALGAVTTVAAVILGQMAAALAIDAVGAFGLATQPITATRIASVALVAAGVVLSRL